MNHDDPRLFDEVSRASLAVLDFSCDFLEMSLIISAFAKARHYSQDTEALSNRISESIVDGSISLSDWDETLLTAFIYACMKSRFIDTKLFDMIGRELTSRDRFDGGCRELGNLATAFSECHEATMTPIVMEMCFQRFHSMTSVHVDASLESIADIFKAIPVAQTLNASIPSNFVDDVAKLAIELSKESRMEDVRDILISVTRIEGLDASIRRNLLDTYKPIYNTFRKDIHPGRQKEIDKLYQESIVNID